MENAKQTQENLELLDKILSDSPECKCRSYNWRDGCYVCKWQSACKSLPLFMTLDRKQIGELGATEKIEAVFDPNLNEYQRVRYQKALEGLRAYDFKPVKDGFLVSAPNEKVYFTRWFPNGGSNLEECSCTCPDFEKRGRKFKQPCKHIWMIKLKNNEMKNDLHVQTSG